MMFERIVSEGLAHFSYFVGDGAVAFVIDPRRDCDVYLEMAKREGMTITHIFETHRNEDYAIGSQELVERTGARVWHGPVLDWGYGETLEDGQEFKLGDLRLRAIHTPGHTDESTSYAIFDSSSGEEAVMVFTGDALFVGDVGRTDLYGPGDRERLSRTLYRSLHEEILKLGDGAIVCPAHGAGSVCGGDIHDRALSTIGLEKLQNPLLQLTEKEFVRRKMAEKLEVPPYFRRMEIMNLKRHVAMSGLPAPKPMLPKEFSSVLSEGAVVLDTRMPQSFAGAHIKGSTSIWLDGLATYAGWLLPYDQRLLLVVEDPLQVERAVRILVRLGYDNLYGYLRGGMVQWYRENMPYETIKTMTVRELRQLMMANEDVLVLDPRPHHEWTEAHLPEAEHIFVGELEKNLDRLPKDGLIASMCSVGFRGGMAAAILKRHGYENVVNVLGGTSAWIAAGYHVVRGDQ